MSSSPARSAGRLKQERHALKAAEQLANQAESLTALLALKDQIRAQGHRFNLKVWLVILGLGLGYLALITAVIGAWPAIVGVFFPLGWLRAPNRPLTKAEYYSLPHARDEDGKHRCIRCGYKGIDRTPGDIAQAKHRCSRCAQPLFKGQG